jgi:hypothetical protein
MPVSRLLTNMSHVYIKNLHGISKKPL